MPKKNKKSEEEIEDEEIEEELKEGEIREIHNDTELKTKELEKIMQRPSFNQNLFQRNSSPQIIENVVKIKEPKNLEEIFIPDTTPTKKDDEGFRKDYSASSKSDYILSTDPNTEKKTSEYQTTIKNPPQQFAEGLHQESRQNFFQPEQTDQKPQDWDRERIHTEFKKDKDKLPFEQERKYKISKFS
ncbi:MAG: hypothetical protein AABX88_01495 [Nanoarchaeota archaeon]